MWTTGTYLSRLSNPQQTKESLQQPNQLHSLIKQPIQMKWYECAEETRATRDQQIYPCPHHRRTRHSLRHCWRWWWQERTERTGFYLRRTGSMTVSPTLNIHCTCSIVHGHVDNKLLEVPTSIIHDHGNEKSEISKVEMNTLIDSGTEGEFIDQNYAWKLRIKQTALEEPIKVFNVDGTWNKWGTITHFTEIDLQIGNRIKWQRLYVTGLGKQKIILGFTWLRKANPDINWQNGDIRWWPIEANEDCDSTS